MSVRARHGAIYFIIFTDNYTRYYHIFLIFHKSEALDCFKRYLGLIENQKNKIMKALCTDQVGEYLSEMFKQFCNEKGIKRQMTIHYFPQQNGVAERQNRTLLDMVWSMMAHANISISL